MPLKRGKSRATIATNIREMVKAGHPRRQAVAASLRTARESRSSAIQSVLRKSKVRGF